MKSRREEFFENLYWIPDYLSKTCSFRGIEKDDLRQELSVILFLSINKFLSYKKKNIRMNCNIYQYCYTACKNRMISYIRSRMAKKRAMKVSLEEVLPERFYSPSQITVKVGGNKVVVDGKDILRFEPSMLRRRIFYKSIEGYSYSEIAEMLEVSISKVRNSVHKTREILKKTQ